MSVITSFKFQNFILFCKCPRKSYSRHRSFSPRSCKPNFFNRRKTFFYKFCQYNFFFCRKPKRCPFFHLGFHNFKNFRVIMPKYHRSPRSNHINIFIPIFIKKFASFCTFNKNGIVFFYGLKSSDWTIYTTWNRFFCFFKNFFRFICIH